MHHLIMPVLCSHVLGPIQHNLIMPVLCSHLLGPIQQHHSRAGVCAVESAEVRLGMQHSQAGSACSALTQGMQQQLAGSPVALQRCSSATAAARRLFDAAAAGGGQTACTPQLESAWSSNMVVLDQTCANAVQQEQFQTPCAVPAPQTPPFDLMRRVISHCQHTCPGVGRACRMLPGLAPCDTSTQQQLSAWLSLQEAELAAAAHVKLGCLSPI
jgi:hypothetical protein